MPAVIPLIVAGVSAAGAVGAAKMSSGAAKDAAGIQAQSAKDSAASQTLAADKAEAFQRQQAEAQWREGEANRHANYDQWRSRAGTIAGVAGQYGVNVPIPDYVASQDPGYGTIGGATPTAGGGSDPKVAAFIANWQKTHPVSEGIAPLAAAVSQQFPGVSRFMYGQTPSDNELNVGGQKYKVLGGENTPAAYWYQPGMNDGAPTRSAGTIGGYSAPAPQPGMVAPMTNLPTPYQPGTIAYAGRRR